MTTWTDIPDEVLEPGKPIRSIDILALRDNILAVPGGAAGAPKVVTNALATNERMTTANVLARTAGASVGAVGTYAFLRPNNTTTYSAGATLAGSSLRFQAGLTTSSSNVNFIAADGGTPSGTWRAMGHRQAANASGFILATAATLWLRIS